VLQRTDKNRINVSTLTSESPKCLSVET